MDGHAEEAWQGACFEVGSSVESRESRAPMTLGKMNLSKYPIPSPIILRRSMSTHSK